MATAEATDEATKQRIIKHMNAAHHDSVRVVIVRIYAPFSF